VKCYNDEQNDTRHDEELIDFIFVLVTTNSISAELLDVGS